MHPKASIVALELLIVLAFQCTFGVSKSRNAPYADESFLRLESGENSDEVINHCCKRDPYLVTVGYGLNDNEIRMDVGKCRQTCDQPAQRSLKREEFDKYLKKYPNVDPLQIFLALQSKVSSSSSSTTSLEVSTTTGGHSSISNSPSSCTASTCQPSGLRMERVYLGGGSHKEVEVVDSCDCIKTPQSCQRTSRPVKINVDTPYERTVDVGMCNGGCGSDDEFVSCKPIRNKTISVEGPNGDQCMNTIEECGCAGSCYRVREFLKVFDYKEVFARNVSNGNSETAGGNETIDRTSLLLERNDVNIIGGQEIIVSDEEAAVGVEPTTKVIDVGRCEGSCGTEGGGRMTSKCLEWRNGTCVSSLYGGHSRCFPSKLLTHGYMDHKGSSHQILSVISCACH